MEPLDKAVGSALVVHDGEDSAESYKITVPNMSMNMDDADFQNRVFSMKSGAFRNGTLNGTQLKTYLRRFDLVRRGRDPECGPVQRLQLYGTVSTMEMSLITAS